MVSSRQLALLATALVLADVVPQVRAGAYCGDCMETALGNHGADTLASIENAWKKYRRALEVKRKIDAIGDDAKKAKAQALYELAKAEWENYEAMAQGYASPELAATLADQEASLAVKLKDATEKIHRLTDLYEALSKSTLQDQRQRILKDIASYEGESKALEKVFKADLWFGGGSAFTNAVELNTAAQLKKVRNVPGWNKAVEDFTSAAKNKQALARRADKLALIQTRGALTGAAGRNTVELQKTLEEDGSKQLAAAVQLVADTGLTATRAMLAAKPELLAKGNFLADKAAPRAGYIALAAPILDSVLLAQAFHELGKAEGRMRALESTEKGWQTRIEAEGKTIQNTKRRLELVGKQREYQAKIADLYTRIQAEEAAP